MWDELGTSLMSVLNCQTFTIFHFLLSWIFNRCGFSRRLCHAKPRHWLVEKGIVHGVINTQSLVGCSQSHMLKSWYSNRGMKKKPELYKRGRKAEFSHALDQPMMMMMVVVNAICMHVITVGKSCHMYAKHARDRLLYSLPQALLCICIKRKRRSMHR